MKKKYIFILLSFFAIIISAKIIIKIKKRQKAKAHKISNQVSIVNKASSPEDIRKYIIQQHQNRRVDKYFGQYHEDVILHHMVSTFLKKQLKDIRYVDIGVMDAILGSNTYFFYKHGAKGYLIDPLSSAGDSVKKYRPKDIFLQYAVVGGRSFEKKTFYVSNYNYDLGAVSSLIKEQGNNNNTNKEIIVETININDFLKKAPKDLDIMSIDIEGMEEEVFESMNFNKYSPKIIVCERPSLRVHDILKKNNYIPYIMTGFEDDQGGVNTFFIKKELFFNFSIK